MYYESTRDNIVLLLNNIPTASAEQLCIFFNQELEPSKTLVLLDDLVSSGRLIYNDQTDCYYERFSHLKKPSILKRYIDAFWPIAKMGSVDVEFVTQCYYPIQYFAITKNQGVFTFNLIENTELARVGAIAREMMKFKGEKDDIRHIAVVYDKSVIDEIRCYGYESYALLLPQKKDVEYYV